MNLNTPMAPKLETPERLRAVLIALQRLEPLFHAAHKDATPQQYEDSVAPEFWEIGASGCDYSRAFALAVLSERPNTPAEETWQTSNYHVMEVAADTYLLTYTLVQPGRTTRRSTIWQRRNGVFKAMFHQGTVVVVE